MGMEPRPVDSKAGASLTALLPSPCPQSPMGEEVSPAVLAPGQPGGS